MDTARVKTSITGIVKMGSKITNFNSNCKYLNCKINGTECKFKSDGYVVCCDLLCCCSVVVVVVVVAGCYGGGGCGCWVLWLLWLLWSMGDRG